MIEGPLEGIRVLDLSRLLPGPLATMILGDLGADVIKIEEPIVGDMTRWFPPFRGEEGANYYLLNRNKRSLTLNLKTPKARKVFHRLAAKADVVVESFRPGVVKRLGVDYESIKKVNPKIIYCAITAYGQDGPYRDLSAHDINIMGISGILAASKTQKHEPVMPSVLTADIGGGTFPTLVAILTALIYQQKTGIGQFIDISMLDGLSLWVPTLLAHLISGEKVPSPKNGRLSGGMAGYGVYKTLDGHVTLGALEPKFWKALCEVMNTPDFVDRLQDDPVSHREMQQVFQEIFMKRPTNEWLECLRDRDICCGPIINLEDVCRNPQIAFRRPFPMPESHKDMIDAQLGLPWKFSISRATTRRPSPSLGEHNHEILKELGLSDSEIRELAT